MNKIINQELTVMEEAKQVKTIFAVESGSRCWGFPSLDSDYDVRFVYARKPKSYMTLKRISETTDWILNDELDMIGWDISKFLRLLQKSNPNIIEWLHSPVQYVTTKYVEELRTLAEKCFDPHTEACAYVNMAYTHDVKYIKSQKATAKRYLYAIRAILAAKWCIERQTPIPILFEDLKNAMLEPQMLAIVDGIVIDKRLGIEKMPIDNIPQLDKWITETEKDIEENIQKLTPKEPISSDELDDIFIHIVQDIWNEN